MTYPFRKIEQKWQSFWREKRIFQTDNDRTKPSFYVLDMFPYPSGAGLHVGHPEGYTATDIVARYKRMQNFNVLHPMGWDAFGLPAERYAMESGIHPAKTTQKNIDTFRRQLQSLGFSYDWEREISTIDPHYYRWTQWIFLQIFNSFYDQKSECARPLRELEIPAEIAADKQERRAFINARRLAYVTKAPVNWCLELQTVLANEEVEEWVSKGYTVEQRPMRQWMLRITAYAERLLRDLQYVDWPAGTLQVQRNWIGRSEGVEIEFPLKGGGSLTVFTTRPDTLYGATYMVVAPEHPLLERFSSRSQMGEISRYLEQTRRRSELERTANQQKREMSGVFSGGFAIHPLSGEELPVWIADYVLASYGSGAIMAVPAHDERDFTFARTFQLPLRQVVAMTGCDRPDSSAKELTSAFSGDGIAVHSPLIEGLATREAIKRMIDHLENEGIGRRKVTYRLRDWLFSRQRYWGEPIPISHDQQGNYYCLDDTSLPLKLPPCDSFQPAASGQSPLANIKNWVEHRGPLGIPLRRETNTMPQWAGSCWYYLRFIDPHNQKALVDPELESYWLGEKGVDLYIGGAEHAVLHLLYARFWHKFLYDRGYVKSREPFHKLVHQGLILGQDGRKMSKSLGNVVNPEDVTSHYGADAFRLFEMFLGPLEQSKPWSPQGIEGVFRFLSRIWRLYTQKQEEEQEEEREEKREKESEEEKKEKREKEREEVKVGKDNFHNTSLDPLLIEEPLPQERREYERMLHSTIQKVSADIERLAFNTAIAQLMTFVNWLYNRKRLGREGAEIFVLLLSPFAPHLAEELWSLLGHKESLAFAPWPKFNESLTLADTIEVVFQVNGKIRGRSQIDSNIEEEALKALALSHEGVRQSLGLQEVRRMIVVKNRLVNIVC